MPHFPKPFFRESRKLWYVELHGKQIKLGREKDAAFQRYHELMAKPAEPAPPVRADAVVVVIDLFLDWCEKNREHRTYEWYKDRCQSFTESISPTLSIRQLKPFHVQQWVDGKSWNDGMKRGAMIAVQRAFNWAVKFGHLDKSPIAYLEKPRAGKRENLITAERYREMLDFFSDQSMQDLLTLAFETGARPQELLRFEARHVDLQNNRIVFPVAEAKGKQRLRIIHLTEQALVIIQRLVMKHPGGMLLRNQDGAPWKRHAVSCRFYRFKKKVGVKYALYDFRHSFCHNALKRGVDPITLANLMGHADTAMIARVYSHLAQDQDYLKSSLRRAVGA